MLDVRGQRPVLRGAAGDRIHRRRYIRGGQAVPAAGTRRAVRAEAVILKDLPRFRGGRCVDLARSRGATVRYLKSDEAAQDHDPQAALGSSPIRPTLPPPSRWSGIPGAMHYRVIATYEPQLRDGRPPDEFDPGLQDGGRELGCMALSRDGDCRRNRTWAIRPTRTAFASAGFMHFVRCRRSRSTVTFGDDYLTSDIFDTFALTGASIRSDDRMLPPSLRGLCAADLELARTNATVTVSQASRVLYVTRVSPGVRAAEHQYGRAGHARRRRSRKRTAACSASR